MVAVEAFIGVEEAVAVAASTTSALRRLAWASTRTAAPWARALAARSHRSRLHLRTSSSSNLLRSSRRRSSPRRTSSLRRTSRPINSPRLRRRNPSRSSPKVPVPRPE